MINFSEWIWERAVREVLWEDEQMMLAASRHVGEQLPRASGGLAADLERTRQVRTQARADGIAARLLSSV